MANVLISSFYIFERSVKYSALLRQRILSVSWCVLWAVLYATGSSWIPLPMVRPTVCVASILFIWALTRIKPDTVISAYLISFGISYVLYFVAIFPVGFIFGLFLSGEHVPGTPVDMNQPIYLLLYALVFSLQFSLSVLLFRIRRFKNGFPFLFKRYAIIMALISVGMILLFVTWGHYIYGAENTSVMDVFIAGVLITGIGIFVWIRRGIKASYQKWAKIHNDELYRQEIAEKDDEIKRLTDLCEAARTANHSMIHRQAAWEDSVTRLVEKSSELHLEIHDELAAALEEIKRLSQEYQTTIDKIRTKQSLPTTRIKPIDALFVYFSEQCMDNKIEFNLKVTGSIPYMVEKVIKQSKLETMIGDHLKNALIAVNASDSPIRSVMAVIGLGEEHYEFAVFDSGIPFEADTLQRLGSERVTTHADEGGSGIGFMTTFETLRECKASLIIQEYKPGGAFSKSVTIRFDGKGQYQKG